MVAVAWEVAVVVVGRNKSWGQLGSWQKARQRTGNQINQASTVTILGPWAWEEVVVV